MNVLARVQLAHETDDLARRRRRRQTMIEVSDACFLRLTRLAGDVDLARGILAHEHDGEPRMHALSRELRAATRDSVPQAFGDGAPVDEGG
jgi:hypothetical protein